MRRVELLVGALALIAVPATRPHAQLPDVDPIRVESVAEKLGVKLAPNSARELELGKSVTGALDAPSRIEQYGIKTMHEGARVTITCVGPNRIRVEVDEMEPVAHDEVVTLRVAEDGALAAAPSSPKPVPKPPA